jgi:AraC family transcriptional regulator, regulatory protein of adaptative response / methylated-DNA-[protein]-cysteine methyltransferase
MPMASPRGAAELPMSPTIEPRDLPDPDTAWAAVLGRDPGFDGRFVYAVGTTGIFCRPTCPSRRPRRDNVRFFRDAAAAAAEGYRPCRRCGPARDASPGAEAVRHACDFLESRLDEAVTLADLGREVGLSPHHLQRTFRRLTGMSPREYLSRRRTERFKARLKKGDSVTTATYEAGYGSSSRLYEQADESLGMTPSTYRRGGLGTRIRFSVVGSPLGRLLVAATDRGVCAVSLGDSDRDLEAGLRAEYPRATLERADAEISDQVTAIAAHLAGDPEPLALPLDLRATAFQWRVWKALQRIPYGATRSYAEVAAAIGRPKAARAVARACASNRLALVVPCHRVVRGDGSSGGYRWGAERKRKLLERERAGTPPGRGR